MTLAGRRSVRIGGGTLMARICINIIRDGSPCIISEDIDYAPRDAGIDWKRDTTDIVCRDDDCWTVDVYDRRTLPGEQVAAFKRHLQKSTHFEVEAEHIADWPTRDWVYVTREVKY